MNRKDGSSSISMVVAASNEEKDVGPTLEELHKVSNDPHLIARAIEL